MEEKKETIVGGQPTGDYTKSGNPKHKPDGTFDKKDSNNPSSDVEKKDDFISEEDLEKIEFSEVEFNEAFEKDIDDLLFNDEDFVNALNEDIDNLLFKEEIPEDVLEKINSSEAFADLYNTPNIDKEKIYGIDEETAKSILKAQQLLEQKAKDNSLIEFDKKEFNGLWTYTVTPSDYYLKEKNGNYANKMAYFINDYQGDDKEEKITLLKEFAHYGEIYNAKKVEFEAKYQEAQELVNQYFKEDVVYSQQVKDNAVWCKNSVESVEQFAIVANKTIKELNAESSKYINDVKKYTGSYSSINNPLRSMEYPHKHSYPEQSAQKKKEFTQTVENITYAIDKSTYDKNIWVQRGVYQLLDSNVGLKIDNETTDEQLANLVGITYKDQGFLSCGAAKNTGFTGRPVIMNIYCPAGTKMLYVPSISKYSTENEMIIQRGYSYKIAKAYKKNGRIYLDVDVQLGTDEDKHQTEKLNELANQWI